jgi:hypothetical protein
MTRCSHKPSRPRRRDCAFADEFADKRAQQLANVLSGNGTEPLTRPKSVRRVGRQKPLQIEGSTIARSLLPAIFARIRPRGCVSVPRRLTEPDPLAELRRVNARSVALEIVWRRLENAQPRQAGRTMFDTPACCGGRVGRLVLPTANPPAARSVPGRGPRLGRGPTICAAGAVRPCDPWEQVGSRAALIPETVPAAWPDLPASALGRNRRLAVTTPQIEPGRLAARRSSVPPVFGTQPSRPAVRVLAELRCKPSEGPV